MEIAGRRLLALSGHLSVLHAGFAPPFVGAWLLGGTERDADADADAI